MFIGIDASRANKKERTGTEWHSYYLIQELKKISHPNDQFVLYSKEPLRDGLEDLPKNFLSRVLNWPPRYFWTQLRLTWEMIRDKPDVLFIPAHILPLIVGKKTLTLCHDVGFERYPELYSKKDLYYHRFGIRRAKVSADKIIAPSEFTRQEMIKLYQIPPEKIITIYNGFDPTFWQDPVMIEEQRKVFAKYQIQKPYLFYIGRLELKKNIPNLIIGFRKYLHKHPDSDLKLVLAGNYGYGFNQILKLISDIQLNDQIILTGYLSRNEHKVILTMAEIFIFPSNYEGFGFPVLEAMACQVPVICSNRASLPEIAGPAAELVDPDRPEMMVMAIEKILTDNSRRQELIDKGRKRCQDFSWQRCAEKTYQLIQSLQGNKKTKSQ